jgi:hypothetical protein
MFRRFLCLSAGVLALLCVTGMPGQLYAQRGRGGFRPGPTPQFGRFMPGFDRRFMDRRFDRFTPGFDRRFMDRRFDRFTPGFDRPLFDPRLGGFSPGFDRRFMDPRFDGF